MEVWLFGSFHSFFRFPNVSDSFFRTTRSEGTNWWEAHHPTAQHHPDNRMAALTSLALVLLVCNDNDDNDNDMTLFVV
jgi:hypothetical protein